MEEEPQQSFSLLSLAQKVAALGAGEILLTSMNNDGTKNGFAIDITDAVSKSVGVPVIASEELEQKNT